MTSTSIFGITIENTLFWKSHLDQLISKLSTACYAIRAVKPIMLQGALVMVYHACLDSIMSYGIIFGGSSLHSINIFRLQKRAIRIIITGVRNRDSCRGNFKRLKILHLQSKYVFSMLMFVVHNMNQYRSSSDIHSKNTRQSVDLYQPLTRLSVYQKGTFYMDIKIFNSLPSKIKDLIHNIKQFKRVLKNFLYLNSFYTLEEYLNCNNK
jgi:hypothetical protein